MRKYNLCNKAEKIKQTVIMRGTGHTQKEIGDKLGMSPQAVSYHLKKLKKRSQQNGVDETLAEIFIDEDMSSIETSVTGLVALKIIQDLEWWLNHHKTNAHWLIVRMWELCNHEGKDLEAIKKICLSALPAYCDSYEFDLEKYLEERTKKVIE